MPTSAGIIDHLLLLHGAIGAADQLEPLKSLLEKDFRVHTINFSGHGGKTFEENFSISQFANEVEDYMKMNQVSCAHIFGYSMGGYVAMCLAKHHPSLVGKLITLGTKYNWDPQIAAQEIKMLNPDVIEMKLPAFADQLKNRHQPNSWKELLSKTSKMLLEMGNDNPLSLHDYKSITKPCLLLLGEKDRMVTVEETNAVEHALPNARFISLLNTPHPIEQVNPGELSVLIRSFLKQ